MLRISLLILALIAIEYYGFIAFKQIFKSTLINTGYLMATIGIISFLTYNFVNFDFRKGQTEHSLFIFSLTLLYAIPKIVIALPLLLEDIVRIVRIIFNLITLQKISIPHRVTAISLIAIGLSCIPFVAILYGIYIGKYNFKVTEKTLFFDDLPDEFDGIRIMQLSDIHSGSLNNSEKVNQAIALINQQQFDILFFTGDLVNNFAHEMTPWIDVFSAIKKPQFGKYAVLGNHDYGEYVQWDNQTDKNNNFEKIKKIHKQIDFQLLLNENIAITKNSSKIFVVGVENWGHNFKQKGDIDLASHNLSPSDFKIVLSHDPTHYKYQLAEHPKNFQLTLSGHTHGLQFGLEIANWFKWSPIQYIYEHWARLYGKNQRLLYVNRGFGFHAYSGRVGIWPEITILELKKTQKK
ncbi:MAG: metallophosphoesterase [Bacteroidota bacterium]|nr:metallophosphoesterase [Bacteroidota bacterium]